MKRAVAVFFLILSFSPTCFGATERAVEDTRTKAAAYYWSGEKAKALEQVDKLKSLKKDDLAGQLSRWIQEKDSKKEPNPVKPS